MSNSLEIKTRREFLRDASIATLVIATSPTSSLSKQKIPKDNTEQENKHQVDLFRSPGSYYSMPLKGVASPMLVVEGFSTKESIERLIETNSAKHLWTHFLVPARWMIKEENIIQKPDVGMDNFVRLYGKENARLEVMWGPRTKPIDDIFSYARKWFLHGNRGYLNETETKIRGERALIIRGVEGDLSPQPPKQFKVSYLSVCHSGMMYAVVFKYTGGFSDPQKTFEKICEGFQFVGKEWSSTNPYGLDYIAKFPMSEIEKKTDFYQKYFDKKMNKEGHIFIAIKEKGNIIEYREYALKLVQK